MEITITTIAIAIGIIVILLLLTFLGLILWAYKDIDNYFDNDENFD